MWYYLNHTQKGDGLMKTVSVVKINISNPALSYYIKTIKSWDEQSQFAVSENGFYGSFLEDKFLAASTMDYDQKGMVNIHMINGSRSNQHHDRIEQETVKRLVDIAQAEYNTDNIQLVYAKKQAVSK